MPIYEYECPIHGQFAAYLLTKEECIVYEDKIPCCKNNDCLEICERIWSLTAMQPDNMWSGIENEQGYFTSKKQHLNYLKQNNMERVDRSIYEEVDKKRQNRFKNTVEKNAEATKKFLTKELASVTID